MDIQEKIKNLILDSLKNLGVENAEVVLEHPADFKMGDYSTNVAMTLAKNLKTNPKELAEKIVLTLRQAQAFGSEAQARRGEFPEIQEIQVAGPGFINFYLSKDFFQSSIQEIIEKQENFGKNETLKDKKVICEFTDPNPFKEFHIGHLMSNTIGESISRIVEWQSAEVKRACYQGDVGLHVAKAVMGLYLLSQTDPVKFSLDLIEKGISSLTSADLGYAYSVGVHEFEEKEQIKKDTIEINKIIFGTKTDHTSSQWIYRWYGIGRQVSLSFFEEIYKKLGTFHNQKENKAFDFYFFESEVGGFGKETVEKNIGKIFEKGEKGAIVFRGENFDKSLHTRVFVNSEGLPTYEAKELGLVKIKYDRYNYDKSIIITGNEINDYFKVLLCAMKQIFPELAQKTLHFSHGMLRLPTGKMSSRTGDVITAESLIEMLKEKVKGDERVAIGAIKYAILRQAVGGDIIFDLEKSVSTEGDSGVYLQYSYARANSILEKAKNEGINHLVVGLLSDFAEVRLPHNLQIWQISEVERLLYRFPEIVLRTGKEFAPHYIVGYLTELARAFNSFYGNNQIINKEDVTSGYKVALSEAFSVVMKNGLNILGIPVLEKM